VGLSQDRQRDRLLGNLARGWFGRGGRWGGANLRRWSFLRKIKRGGREIHAQECQTQKAKSWFHFNSFDA
jgi:hypothetical protein